MVDHEQDGAATGRGRIAAAAAVLALVSVAALAAGTGQASAGTAPPGNISTLAGGVGGPGKATKVALADACGASYSAGLLYIADGPSVREVSPQTDRLTTPAGNGHGGQAPGEPAGDGSPAPGAFLDTCSAAVDAAGNLVLADTLTDRIRVVAESTGTFYGQAMTAGDIYTVAGDGTTGYSGDGGPATEAELNDPQAVAIDGAGNLLIADSGNNRIRVVAESTGRFYGQAMTAGDIYTVAGDGTAGYSGDGGKATEAELNGPRDVVVDGAGNLVISDAGNGRVRVVAARTRTFYGQAMTARHIYTAASIPDLSGVAVDGAGNVVVAEPVYDLIRVIAGRTGTFYGQAMTAGGVYPVAGDGKEGSTGDGGPATQARLGNPQAVTVDGAGNLVIADTGNDLIRVVAESPGTFYGQAMTAGNIYAVAGTGMAGFSGHGGPAGAAELSGPDGVTVDGVGNVLVADPGDNRLLLVAASSGTYYGKQCAAGNIYPLAGNGRPGIANGVPATSAALTAPEGVALDGAGNVVIADAGAALIRVVAENTGTFYGQAMTAGDIYTVAGDGTAGYSGDGGPATGAELDGPQRVAIDGAGNLVIADTLNQRIRVVAESTGRFYGQAMTAGDIYTVAGDGTAGYSGDGRKATKAELDDPSDVTVDGAGNLVIADTGNDRIRVAAASSGIFYGQAMTAGDIYTVAGDGSAGYSGDGGPATAAELAGPRGVAVDGTGNLVITDTGNQRIRVAAVGTGTFYGQAMTAGDIYTVAGDGTAGYSGDGGPATAAELNDPGDAAPDGLNGLQIADTGNELIRAVTPG